MKFLINILLLLLVQPCLPALAGEGDSLIDPDNYRGISADRRAYRIGDPITVVVLETALAESSAGTGAAKGWEISGETYSDDLQHRVGGGVSGNADGTGQTTRQGSLRAQLSVRVIAVENRDLLRVRGEQDIMINGETQTIMIEGLVRSDDIGPDNTVISYRLSEANIEFTGDGVVAESQKQGWVYKILNWMGVI